MMTEPVVAQKKPYNVDVKAGREYHWCACGKSTNQPFCDGSHMGTEFKPHIFTLPKMKLYISVVAKIPAINRSVMVLTTISKFLSPG